MSAGPPDYFAVTNAFRETGWGGARAQIFYHVLGAMTPVTLHAASLARAMKMNRSTVCVALADLVRSGILRDRDGLYEVAADRCDSWPRGKSYDARNLPGRRESPVPPSPDPAPAASPWQRPVGYVNGPDDVLRPLTPDPSVSNDPAAVHRVAEKADRLFDPQKNFGLQVSTWAGQFDLAWIERALEDAATWPTPPATFQPILNKLRGWQRDGGPPKLAETPRRRPPRNESAGMSVADTVEEIKRRRRAREMNTGEVAP